MAIKRTQAPVLTPVTPGAVSTCFELRFDSTQLKDDILRHLHCSLARADSSPAMTSAGSAPAAKTLAATFRAASFATFLG